MFVMHSQFDLRAGIDIDRFQAAWDQFVGHMKAKNLITGAGALYQRFSDTPLDTNEEPAQALFVVMHFRDQAQARAAWDELEGNRQPSTNHHRTVYAMVRDAVFTCWEEQALAGHGAVVPKGASS